MRFQVLGSLAVVGDAGLIPITGTKRRALLAILLMHAGKVVSIPRLVDGIWPDGPPESAVFNIRTYVHSIRRMLAWAGDSPERLTYQPGGYHLTVATEELDLLRFGELVAAGHRAAKQGRWQASVDHFDRALSLWRGDPLEDIPGLGEEVTAELVVLEEQRRAAMSCAIDARLMLGNHEELIPLLLRMIAERPLCERTRAQLVIALYCAGRTAEALSAYRSARQTVIDELGVEPGACLQRAHLIVLNGQRPRPLPWKVAPDDPDPATATVAAWPAVDTASGGVVTAPRGLPPKPPNFVGRESSRRQLTAIGEAVSARTAADAHAAVVSISGPPGVGKSALAVAAAYDLRHRYPDGQIFVALEGSTDSPRSPSDTLGELLSALGVEPPAIPAGLRERTMLFRSVAADRSMLLVLDDAASAKSVRPLLPGAGRCMVFVTSRLQLLDLEVVGRVNLGPLSQTEALQLLADTAGPDRMRAAPDVFIRIAAACERLPLALRIAGARLSTHPSASPSSLAERLEDEESRLGELTVGDISVRDRLSQSYRALDSTTRRAFIALGRSGASMFTEATAKELLGQPRQAVDRVIESLVHHNLLTPVAASGHGEQYQMSALMRIYAREHVEPENARTRVQGLLA